MFRQARTVMLTGLAALVLAAGPVSAQTATAAGGAQPAGQPQGPIIVEPIGHALVLVPDVRFGEVNGRSATLVGGYAGVVMDERLLVGGGGYWLANNARDREMFYAGGMVGWYLVDTDRLNVGLMSLVGGGQGTVGYDVDYPVIQPFDDVRFGHRPPHGPGPMGPGRYLARQDFFIAEPMLSVVWRVAEHVGLSGSVGYRLVGGAGSLNDQFEGMSGSVGVVFGAR